MNEAHVGHAAPQRRRTWRLLLAAMAAAGGVVASAYHGQAHEGERPRFTITATDDALTVPDEVPGGLVDITIDTEPSVDDSNAVGHHLLIARLDEGVTLTGGDGRRRRGVDDDDAGQGRQRHDRGRREHGRSRSTSIRATTSCSTTRSCPIR